MERGKRKRECDFRVSYLPEEEVFGLKDFDECDETCLWHLEAQENTSARSESIALLLPEQKLIPNLGRKKREQRADK